MCGRTACTLEPGDICKACCFRDKLGNWVIPSWRDSPDGRQYYPSYNVPPTNHTPVMISERHVDENCEVSGRLIQPMYWSLVPSWHRGELRDVGFSTNNARLETIMKKNMFSVPLKKGRRCVVLADGYYEWQQVNNKTKQPYFIYFPQPANVKIENHDSWESPDNSSKMDEKDGWKGPRLLTMAGVFNIWNNPNDSTEVYSYAIVTRDALPIVSFIHERMPVILDGTEEINNWLDFGRVPLEEALKGIEKKSVEVANLVWHPVSNIVGKSTNKAPECIQPVDLKVKVPESKSSSLMRNWLKKATPIKNLESEVKLELQSPKRERSSEESDEKVVKKGKKMALYSLFIRSYEVLHRAYTMGCTGTGIDKLAGLSMVSFSAFVFIYYTIWVIILPFVDAEHAIHSFFLPRFYAIAVPLSLAVVAAFGLFGFVVFVMMGKDLQKKTN